MQLFKTLVVTASSAILTNKIAYSRIDCIVYYNGYSILYYFYYATYRESDYFKLRVYNTGDAISIIPQTRHGQ